MKKCVSCNKEIVTSKDETHLVIQAIKNTKIIEIINICDDLACILKWIANSIVEVK